MEFNVKLQELRKNRGLTQEELAGKLYVSRTAVSKWESGRGYPNIDSLKAIATFFDVTVDELLSGQELLELAEENTIEKGKRLRDLIFGLLDCSLLIFFFLPLFGVSINGTIESVSLLALKGIAGYLWVAYFAVIIGIILTGIGSLALQNVQSFFWHKVKITVSLFLNAVGAVIFIVSLQPYAAVYLFVFLVIKSFMLLKSR